METSKPIVAVANLASLDEKFVIHYNYNISYNSSENTSEIALSWREILKIIGPEFRTPSNTSGVAKALNQYMRDVVGRSYHRINFFMTNKEHILNQMELLGFMKANVYSLKTGGQGLFHTLTPAGVAEVLRLNAVTTSQ